MKAEKVGILIWVGLKALIRIFILVAVVKAIMYLMA